MSASDKMTKFSCTCPHGFPELKLPVRRSDCLTEQELDLICNGQHGLGLHLTNKPVYEYFAMHLGEHCSSALFDEGWQSFFSDLPIFGQVFTTAISSFGSKRNRVKETTQNWSAQPELPIQSIYITSD